jgi:hypothetical protein
MLTRALLLLMIAFGTTANGQSLTEVPQHGVGIRAHYGFLFAHHPEMRHLMGRHFGSAEVFYQHTFSGNKSWHHHYNFPSWGISVLYYAFPNPALGNAHAVFPYLYLPLTKASASTSTLLPVPVGLTLPMHTTGLKTIKILP